MHAPADAIAQVATAAPLASVAYAAEESRPVLPPRPTGRMQTEPTRSFWRNWPVIVIVIACAAIATAVVLMLWPPAGTAKADGRKGIHSPAPERMDTNPLPPQGRQGQAPPLTGNPDPWGAPGTVPRSVPPPPPPPADPDPDDIDPDDLGGDPFANPRYGGRGLGTNPFTGGGAGYTLVLSMVKHACDRMKTCPSSAATAMCSTFEQSFGSMPTPPPNCAAAQRCLAQIDRLDLCGSSNGPFGGSGLAEVTMLMSTAQDCIDAARC